LEVLVRLLDPPNHGLEIPKVVEGIEHAKHIHPVRRRPIHERLDHIIGIVAVAHQILAAQEHRERRLDHVLLQGAEPLPGILVQESVHRVERGPAPDLHGPKPDLVHHLRNGQHVLGATSGRKQGLVSVPEGQILHLDSFGSRLSVRAVRNLRLFHDSMLHDRPLIVWALSS